MTGRRSAGSLTEVNVLRVELAGIPTCVHAADLELVYKDGSTEVLTISYAPNGVMYEVFEDQVRALRALIGQR